MKIYLVNITDEVEASIRDAFFFINEQSPQNAKEWLTGLYQAVGTLETFPERCPTIRENDAFEMEVRNLVFQSFRILFTVNEDTATVEVHAFRHGAQRDIAPGQD